MPPWSLTILLRQIAPSGTPPLTILQRDRVLFDPDPRRLSYEGSRHSMQVLEVAGLFFFFEVQIGKKRPFKLHNLLFLWSKCTEDLAQHL